MTEKEGGEGGRAATPQAVAMNGWRMTLTRQLLCYLLKSPADLDGDDHRGL